jgi:hypothetical protein
MIDGSCENRIYEIISDQYQLEWQRTRDIESKAVNVVLFSGLILGLEFNLLSNFCPDVLGSGGNYMYGLVAISSAFFVSTILLGISALLVSRSHCVAYLLSTIEKRNKDDGTVHLNVILSDVSSKLFIGIEKNNAENKIKYRYLKSSLRTFLSGIVMVIILFGLMLSLNLYP